MREYQLYLRAQRRRRSCGFFQPTVSALRFLLERRYSGTGWWSRYPTRGRRHGSPKLSFEEVSSCVHEMCERSEPHDTADDVWSWSAVDGSGEPQKERYRLANGW